MDIRTYITRPTVFPLQNKQAWEIVGNLEAIIRQLLAGLGAEYHIANEIAIHHTAQISPNATINAPAIICEGCFVGAHSFLRNGVFLAPHAKIGVSCEIKTAVILEDSAIAHFNFVGDSFIGHNVNIEAGAILANHYNERDEKTVFMCVDNERISTGLHKFGSLVGDDCRIGANAVLSPGSVLEPRTIVKRLQLVEQDPQ